MGDLSAAQRKKIPKSKFGIPSKAKTAGAKSESGNYPMPDKEHASLAKSFSTKAVKAGRMSPSQKSSIDAKANKILGKGSATKKSGARGK